MIDIACTEYLIEIAEKKKGDFVYMKGNSALRELTGRMDHHRVVQASCSMRLAK